MSRRLLFSLIALALIHLLLILGVEPIQRLFFIWAWIVYIWVSDSLILKRKGSSLLTTRRRELFQLLPWSVFIWLIFELYNIVLKNWRYEMLPESTLIRWPGYAFSFSTVLVALSETHELLASYGILRNSRTRPLAPSASWYRPFVFVGVCFLSLPLLWPNYFFPLVWVGFIFLLEPLNHRLGGTSLMGAWERGSRRYLYLALISGLIVGLFWEFWNYWAISKWVYTVPFVNRFKIFEMPLLGYLGFPPFAVQCYVMMNTVRVLKQRWQKHNPPPLGMFRISGRDVVIGLALLAFSLVAFHLIDVHTVSSFQPFRL